MLLYDLFFCAVAWRRTPHKAVATARYGSGTRVGGLGASLVEDWGAAFHRNGRVRMKGEKARMQS